MFINVKRILNSEDKETDSLIININHIFCFYSDFDNSVTRIIFDCDKEVLIKESLESFSSRLFDVYNYVRI